MCIGVAVCAQYYRGPEAHKAAATKLQCVSPRQFGVRYDVEHLQRPDAADDRMLVTSNINGCKNFNLFTVPLDQLGGTLLVCVCYTVCGLFYYIKISGFLAFVEFVIVLHAQTVLDGMRYASMTPLKSFSTCSRSRVTWLSTVDKMVVKVSG